MKESINNILASAHFLASELYDVARSTDNLAYTEKGEKVMADRAKQIILEAEELLNTLPDKYLY